MSISFQTWYLQTVILIKAPHYPTLLTADDRLILATLHQHQCFTLMARASVRHQQRSCFFFHHGNITDIVFWSNIAWILWIENWLKDDHPFVHFHFGDPLVTSEAAPNSSSLASIYFVCRVASDCYTKLHKVTGRHKIPALLQRLCPTLTCDEWSST